MHTSYCTIKMTIKHYTKQGKRIFGTVSFSDSDGRKFLHINLTRVQLRTLLSIVSKRDSIQDSNGISDANSG